MIEVFAYFLIFIFGSIIGSFLNVVILRLPAEKNLGGRSACWSCGHTLGFFDLFPVFSYLFLRGKCRYCKIKVSPRYLIIEIFTALLFMFSWWQLSPQVLKDYLQFASICLAVCIFVIVFVIDLEHFLIFDGVIYIGALLIFAINFAVSFNQNQLFVLNGNWLSGIMGAIFVPLPFLFIWYFSKGRWMGLGDVKFCIFLGMLLGLKIAVVSLFFSIFIGGIASLGLLALGKKQMTSKIPFGTFLSLGGFLAFFYGSSVLSWYLAVLGY